MRQRPPEKLEAGRIRTGTFASNASYGMTGAFHIQGPCGAKLAIISDDGNDQEAHGWEHVSVSVKHRPPNWTEMSFVKDLFWEADETVVQFHPRRSEYVNCHPFCLHLWSNRNFEYLLPPSILVGPTPVP